MLELVVIPGVLVAFGGTKEEMPGMYEDIVDTVREPLIVLDPDLRVLSANRSFYNSFRVIPEETIGNLISVTRIY